MQTPSCPFAGFAARQRTSGISQASSASGCGYSKFEAEPPIFVQHYTLPQCLIPCYGGWLAATAARLPRPIGRASH
jgi:hypothetical protein